MPQMLQAIEQNVQSIGIVYFQGVVSMVPKTSLAPTLQDIATALSYPSELDVKIQFLKTLHTLTTGHGKIKLILIWKLQPYFLSFIILGSAIIVLKEKSNQWS